MLVLTLVRKNGEFQLHEKGTTLIEGISRAQLMSLLPRLEAKGFHVDGTSTLLYN